MSVLSKSDWRALDRVMVIITNSDQIAISDCKLKKYYQILIRNLRYDGIKARIELKNSDFKIRFNKRADFEVKHFQLPDPDKWYVLQNYDTSSFMGNMKELLLGMDALPSKDGELPNTYEFFVSTAPPERNSSCIFGNKTFQSFKSFNNELRRSTLFSLLTKTKKLIPGNEYFTSKDILIYLGEFTTLEGSHRYLFTNEILDSDTTISDVLKRSKGFGNNSLVYYNSIPISVNNGNVLINDLKTVAKLQEYLIDEEYKSFSFYSKWSLAKKWGNFNFNNIFQFIDPTEEIKLSIESKNKLNEILQENFFRKIIEIWNPPYQDVSNSSYIGSQCSYSENLEKLKLYSKSLKIQNLTSKIGLDLDSIIKNSFDRFLDIKKGISSGEINYITGYLQIFNTKIFEGSNKWIWSKAYEFDGCRRYIYTQNKSLKDSCLLGSDILLNEINDIYLKATNNYGLEISNYRVTNIGTVSKPLSVIYLTITLDDILTNHGGILPKELEDEISKYKFISLQLAVREERENLY